MMRDVDAAGQRVFFSASEQIGFSSAKREQDDSDDGTTWAATRLDHGNQRALDVRPTRSLSASLRSSRSLRQHHDFQLCAKPTVSARLQLSRSDAAISKWLEGLIQQVRDGLTKRRSDALSSTVGQVRERGMLVSNVNVHTVGSCALVRFPPTALDNDTHSLFAQLGLDKLAHGSGSPDTLVSDTKGDTNGSEHSIELDVFPSSSSDVSLVFWKDGVRRNVPELITSRTQRQTASDGDSDSDGDEINRKQHASHLNALTCKAQQAAVRNRRKCVLPLAPVAPPNFDYDAFCSLWNEVQPCDALRTMIGWMTSDVLSRILGQPQFRRKRTHDRISRKITFDIDGLIRSRTVEPVPQHSGITNLLTSTVFTVPKSDGESSRFIWDGRVFDEIFRTAMGPPPDMPLPKIPAVIDGILSGWKIISSNDVKSMFYQFSVYPSLRKFFGFDVTHGNHSRVAKYRLCALPMGICFAPTFAQHVSNFICDIIRHRLRDVKFFIMTWIDNFIVCTNSPADDARVRTELDALTKFLRLEMKGWEGGSSRLDALGIHFDLGNRIATPTQLRQEKLKQATHVLQSRKTNRIRNAAFMRWFGLI